MTFNQPMSGNAMPRYAGPGTMMRLPAAETARGLDACFVGVPLDIGASHRAGTRFGPRQIRAESTMLRPYNMWSKRSPFARLQVADIGDVATCPFDLKRSVAIIEAAFDAIVATGAVPLALGGDHTLTLPILRAMAKAHGPVGLIHVDAHADVNDAMFGEEIAHGTPFRRAVEEGLLDNSRVVQIGLRGTGYSDDDFDWSRAQGFRVVQAEECWHRSLAPLMAEVRAQLGSGPVYLSFDIDSLDPAYAPGTGTLEIGGLTSVQALEIIRGAAGLDIVGCDLVEVSPPYDPGGSTALIAANLLYEMLHPAPPTRPIIDKPQGSVIRMSQISDLDEKPRRGGDWLKFIVPSLLGAMVFLMPISDGETVTIPFGILIDLVNDNFGALVLWLLVAVTVVSAAGTLYVSFWPGQAAEGFVARVFRVSPTWIALRVLGAVFCVLFVTGLGPEWIVSEATGGTVVGLLMTNLLALFFFAALALPLLTDYGFMEFVGAFLSRAFRVLFRLPGRSAIDGLASWLGAAPIGVMLTVQQYDQGGYSRREAATIATTFSIVSIPFCYVIARVVGLSDVFFAYYGSVVLIGFVCALILPRIPPLSWISDEYNPETGRQIDDVILPGESALSAGTRLGLERSRQAPGFAGFLQNGLQNLVSIWFGLVPATLAIAMIALILVEYTPIFQWLSLPFVTVLGWAGVAEAQAAAPALVVGFADMYLPALIGRGVESQETRFLIAILSVSQLIYMSEVGALLLRANLGLNIGHLAMIFVIRTLIATPIAILLAKFVVF